MTITAKEKAQARAFLFNRGLKPSGEFVALFALRAKELKLSFGQLYDKMMEG